MLRWVRPGWVFLSVMVGGSTLALDCKDGLKPEIRSTQFTEHRDYRISMHGENGIRTPWGSGEKILALNKPYRKLKLEHPWEPFVPVAIGSLGEKNPEIVFILDDICHYQLDLPRFEEEFQEAFGKLPQAHDYVSFYESRFLIFEDGVESWIAELKKVSPAQGTILESSYRRKIRELHGKIGSFHSERGLEPVKKTVEGFQSNVFGMMGELYGISAIPHVKTASTLIGDMPDLLLALDSRMKGLRDEIRKDPSMFDALMRQFPHVFESTAVVNQFKESVTAIAEKKLEYIQRWIKQKEIDLVRKVDGVETWLELKTKKNPMTLEEFSKDRKGWKSPERQILEDREIIEFLGLSHRIKLEYYVTAGMTDDLIKALRDLGVNPLEFKSKPRGN